MLFSATVIVVPPAAFYSATDPVLSGFGPRPLGNYTILFVPIVSIFPSAPVGTPNPIVSEVTIEKPLTGR